MVKLTRDQRKARNLVARQARKSKKARAEWKKDLSEPNKKKVRNYHRWKTDPGAGDMPKVDTQLPNKKGLKAKRPRPIPRGSKARVPPKRGKNGRFVRD